MIPNSPGVLAQDIESITNEQSYTEAEFTMEEIMALEQYISVNNEGLFIMNHTEAIADGVSIKLLEGQQGYLDYLNSEIKDGNLKVHKNLEIEDLELNLTNGGFSLLASCNGKSTAAETKLWGQTRKFNSCEADRFAADLASVAAGSAGVGLVTAWIPGMGWAAAASTAYMSLYSSRVYANNSNNTGVIIDMTWAMVYNITPQ